MQAGISRAVLGLAGSHWPIPELGLGASLLLRPLAACPALTPQAPMPDPGTWCWQPQGQAQGPPCLLPLPSSLRADSAPSLLLCCPQVGKHLGDVSNALPLRCVCKEWREVATLGAVEATLDLEPRLNTPAGTNTSISSDEKEQRFFKACPQLRKLTYHMSPWVSLAQVRVLHRATLCVLSCMLAAGSAPVLSTAHLTYHHNL